MTDGPWIGAGSATPSTGRLVRTFSAVDEDGVRYLVSEFLLTIRSKLVRPDALSAPSQQRPYWKLADGKRVARSASEPQTYKILQSQKLIREVP